MLAWLKIKDNREALGVALAVVTTLAGGGWFVYEQFLKPKSPSKPSAAIIVEGDQTGTINNDTGDGPRITMGDNSKVVLSDEGATAPVVSSITFELKDYEQRQLYLRQQITAELNAGHAEDRTRLEQELAEVQRRLADLPAAFADAQARIAELESRLAGYAGQIDGTKLAAARDALAKGDTTAAEALFAQVEKDREKYVEEAAEAAYAQGLIAQGDIRWRDAARHYARAATLAPDFERLLKAQDYTERSGDYKMALRFGADLVDLAQGLDDENRLADALNNHALGLLRTGNYTAAEPLMQQALEITAKALGTDHPDYAIRLNNLAQLLKDTGRYQEAEPLMRQALAIDAKALGEDHPKYATRLNNLAQLLQATGRFAEAEPLMRQSLRVFRAALGMDHPNTMGVQKNLDILLAEIATKTSTPTASNP